MTNQYKPSQEISTLLREIQKIRQEQTEEVIRLQKTVSRPVTLQDLARQQNMNNR